MSRLSLNQILFLACKLDFGIEFLRNVDSNPVTSGANIEIVTKDKS